MWLLVECHVYLHLYAIIIEQAISEKKFAILEYSYRYEQ